MLQSLRLTVCEMIPILSNLSRKYHSAFNRDLVKSDKHQSSIARNKCRCNSGLKN